jgi:hypothetical protein
MPPAMFGPISAMVLLEMVASTRDWPPESCWFDRMKIPAMPLTSRIVLPSIFSA